MCPRVYVGHGRDHVRRSRDHVRDSFDHVRHSRNPVHHVCVHVRHGRDHLCPSLRPCVPLDPDVLRTCDPDALSG